MGQCDPIVHGLKVMTVPEIDHSGSFPALGFIISILINNSSEILDNATSPPVLFVLEPQPREVSLSASSSPASQIPSPS